MNYHPRRTSRVPANVDDARQDVFLSLLIATVTSYARVAVVEGGTVTHLQKYQRGIRGPHPLLLVK